MKTSTVVWTVIVLIIIVGGAWYWFANSSSSSPTSTTTTTSTTTSAVPVLSTSSNTTLGTYLVSPSGMTLYTYNQDTSGVSNCTGQCAVVWPPYTVASGTQFSVPSGITGALNTIVRADGTVQLTYKGKPLYFFAQDTAPGQATGQNNNGFTVATP